MEKICNLRDLFIEQLRELYNAERQQNTELLIMKTKATDADLKKVIQENLDMAMKTAHAAVREYLQRNEYIFIWRTIGYYARFDT